MREWIPRRADFLHVILDREAPNPCRSCASCSKRDADWRCLSCIGLQLFCRKCIRTSHQHLPFHRVEQWMTDRFEPSWLSKAGVQLHTGHGGNPCAGRRSSSGVGSVIGGEAMDETWEDDEKDIFGSDPSSSGMPSEDEMIIVDRSGVHRMQIEWC
jgi:hypothetical protein